MPAQVKAKADKAKAPYAKAETPYAKAKAKAVKAIGVVPNFGGRRCDTSVGPSSVQAWGLWDCDPEDASGRAPTQQHGYGRSFPWHFDMLEKAYVLEGSATLTPDDAALHGPPVTIAAGDMVTFPKGWRGRWEVHSFLNKRYAFFDGKGIRVDEHIDEVILAE